MPAVARQGVLYLLLAMPAVLFLTPLAWMVSTAFKPTRLIYAYPPVWLPTPPTLDNFIQGWRQLPWPLFFRNSFQVTLLTLFGGLVSSSMVGFAFASMPARGRNLLFGLLLATLMIPSAVTLVPTFILFSRMGWVNTYLPLVVPQFFANPFFFFMFRQFFRAIPRDLCDSAEMDGCSPAGLYVRIAIPLSRPVFATVAVLSSLATWNDFIGPLTYLTSTHKFTLALGLSLFQGMNYTQLQYLMPMSLLAMLPVLLFFFLTQRYLVESIVTTGIKM